MNPRIGVAIVFLVGAVTGAAVVAVGGAALASSPDAAAAAPVAARVLAVGDRVTRVAPHGKARITTLAEGQHAFVGLLDLDGGANVPEHQDETEETIHVLAGSGSITIDGTTTAVGTGDTVFMPAGATVSYRNGPETLRAIQVFAGPAPARKYDSWAVR